MGWVNWLLLGDLGQQLDIASLEDQVQRIRAERSLSHWDSHAMASLVDELIELEIRHGLLVRLLIRKGLITAEEYAELIATSQLNQNASQTKPSSL